MDNNNYEGNVEDCAMCSVQIYVDSIFDEYKWIDGVGYLCSECMSLDEYSSPEDNFIDEDIEDILDEV